VPMVASEPSQSGSEAISEHSERNCLVGMNVTPTQPDAGGDDTATLCHGTSAARAPLSGRWVCTDSGAFVDSTTPQRPPPTF
jgi:hypothetical protein